jgi:undecaprenyl-diphosphatase
LQQAEDDPARRSRSNDLLHRHVSWAFTLIASITTDDRHVLIWIVDHRLSPLNPIFEAITFAATGGTVWVALAALIAWGTHRPILPIGILAAACVWGADGISHLLKLAMNRPRPYVAMPHLHTLIARPGSDSFPSSHATTAFAGAVVLSFLLPRLWPIFAIGAVLVAYSRLYVGVHYPTDVLAGAIVGAAVAGLVIAVMRRTADARCLQPTHRRAVTWF